MDVSGVFQYLPVNPVALDNDERQKRDMEMNDTISYHRDEIFIISSR